MCYTKNIICGNCKRLLHCIMDMCDKAESRHMCVEPFKYAANWEKVYHDVINKGTIDLRDIINAENATDMCEICDVCPEDEYDSRKNMYSARYAAEPLSPHHLNHGHPETRRNTRETTQQPVVVRRYRPVGYRVGVPISGRGTS